MTKPRPTLITVPPLYSDSVFSSNNSTPISGSAHEQKEKCFNPLTFSQARSPTTTRSLYVQKQRRIYHREPTPSPEPLLTRKRYSISPASHPLPKSRGPSPASSHAPISTTARERILWLALYFALNLALTLYNKFVLIRFPFPYTLSALHALCGVIGTHGIIHVWLPRYGGGRLAGASATELNPIPTGPERRILAAFSVLYAVNIAVSNASLELVTVPFHQVVRATTPVFTLLLAPFLRLRARTTRGRLTALIPVVLGVGIATYGDYYFTCGGLLLTFVGTILAAFKTLVTNLLQSSPSSVSESQKAPDPSTPPTPILTSKPSSSALGVHQIRKLIGGDKGIAAPRRALHPFALLHLLSPLAFVYCILAAQISGELVGVLSHLLSVRNFPRHMFALLANGVIAFALNVVSFSANGKVGAVNMSVAANVKQALTILLAVVLFDLHITVINAVGIVLTLVGGAWYARVEHVERGR